MRGVRSIFMIGKYSNFWSKSTISNWSLNNDISCFRKRIGHFRSYRSKSSRTTVLNQTPLPKVNGIDLSPPDPKRAWKPILFTFAFSSGSIAAAAIWQYENARSRAKTAFRNSGKWLESQIQHPKRGAWREELNRKWNSLSEGEKIFFPICFLNCIVYIAWQIPKLQPAMFMYFCSNPSAKMLCWPLVLSTFSHYSFLHLAANMYVLHSFSDGATGSLGKEQFLGFYLAAGCISSLISYLYKTAIGLPGLSLGASGAIMAIIGYVCTAYPDTELSLLFLPFLHFKADIAIKALIALDIAGLIFRWQFFDHAAHLGGAIFGIIWCWWGNQYVWAKRKPILEAWHKMRTYFDK